MQAAAFSGDKWFHNHAILGCCGPDGMIYDLFDGPVGRRVDKHFMRMRLCAIASCIIPMDFIGFTLIRGSREIRTLGVLIMGPHL